MGNPANTAKALRLAAEKIRLANGTEIHFALDLVNGGAIKGSGMVVPELLELAAGQMEFLISLAVNGATEAPPLYDSVKHIGELRFGPIEGCECEACRKV